jgi:hypothetical protein
LQECVYSVAVLNTCPILEAYTESLNIVVFLLCLLTQLSDRLLLCRPTSVVVRTQFRLVAKMDLRGMKVNTTATITIFIVIDMAETYRFFSREKNK